MNLEKLYKEKTRRINVFSEEGCLIRSIHFDVQTTALPNSKLKQYFRQFGEYLACVVRKKNSFTEGYINFKNGTDAGLILQSRHFCGGFEINVKQCHGWNLIPIEQTDEKSPITEPLQILDFDDDCLFHIFSRLHLNDLCNVFWTSQRLQAIAINVFCVKHTKIDLSRENYLTPSQTHQVLSCFEKYIRELEVVAMVFKEEFRAPMLKTIFKYCSSLRKLHLTGFKFKVKALFTYFLKIFHILFFFSLDTNSSTEQRNVQKFTTAAILHLHL